MPDRKTRILMEPTISLRRTLPLALTWWVKVARRSKFFDSRMWWCTQEGYRSGSYTRVDKRLKQSVPYQEVDWLNDIQEDFVFPVLDALRAPRNSIGDSGRWAGRTGVQLVPLLSYIPDAETKTSQTVCFCMRRCKIGFLTLAESCCRWSAGSQSPSTRPSARK